MKNRIRDISRFMRSFGKFASKEVLQEFYTAYTSAIGGGTSEAKEYAKLVRKRLGPVASGKLWMFF